MNWLTQPLERVFLRPLRSLGGLSFDVVVSEEHEGYYSKKQTESANLI